MGCGDSFYRRGFSRRRAAAGNERRRVPHLLRLCAAELVRARQVRLMYTELHARSAFSFLEGASFPEELAALCAEYGMNAMALVDRDGVYGAPRFHLAAQKSGISAHIGAEVTTELGKIPLLDGESPGPISRGAGFRLSLLVSSRIGYQNLCRLLTTMKLRARKNEGAVSSEELEEHAPG